VRGRRASGVVRPDEIRQHNLSLLLRHVHRDGALTRAELTQRLHLSRSTVGTLVGDLAQLGLVEEVVPSGGIRVGRPSHVVAPHAHGPYAVGVDIDIEHVTVAAIGLGGTIIERLVFPTPVDVTPDGVVALVADAVARLALTTGSTSGVCGIGVSVPGTVDLASGRVGFAPNLGWEGVCLGAMLAEVAPDGVPVVVGNDADLAVLAEHQRGNARDQDDHQQGEQDMKQRVRRRPQARGTGPRRVVDGRLKGFATGSDRHERSERGACRDEIQNRPSCGEYHVAATMLAIHGANSNVDNPANTQSTILP